MGRNDLERSWIGHDDSLGLIKRLMTDDDFLRRVTMTRVIETTANDREDAQKLEEHAMKREEVVRCTHGHKECVNGRRSTRME
eukprot:scaffold44519_cov51-Cyclotella_meneghiniana.AAC.3